MGGVRLRKYHREARTTFEAQMKNEAFRYGDLGTGKVVDPGGIHINSRAIGARTLNCFLFLSYPLLSAGETLHESGRNSNFN